MQDLVIYGAGGFGRETALMIEEINQQHRSFNLIGFCDDAIPKGERVDDYEVLGNSDYINTFGGMLAVAIAVADCSVRRNLRAQIKNRNVSFPSLIHPSVLRGAVKKNVISEGVILTAANVLTTNVRFDPFVIVNLACTIGHDVRVGAFGTIMPGCSISGHTVIDEGTLVGTGARLLPGLTVGKSCRIGAGAVVTRSVPDFTTVVGIPAEPLK